MIDTNGCTDVPCDDVLVVGSGPSVSDEQIAYIAEFFDGHIIAINDSYRLVPWAQTYFAADIKWWRHHFESAYDVCCIPIGVNFWTLEGNLEHIAKTHSEAISSGLFKEAPYERGSGLNKNVLNHGGNSGYLAVNLAYHFGAKRIILIGFDHQHTYGKRHWFGDHDKSKFNKNADDTERWLTNFDELATDLIEEGIDLVNCSIETAITSCRRSTIENEVEAK